MRLKPPDRGCGKGHAEGMRGDSEGRGGQGVSRVARSGDSVLRETAHPRGQSDEARAAGPGSQQRQTAG